VTLESSSVTQLLCPVPMSDTVSHSGLTREELRALLLGHLSQMTFAKCRACKTKEMTGFGRLTKRGKQVPMCDACISVQPKPPRRCDDCPEIAKCFVSEDYAEEYMARHGPDAPQDLCMSCYTARRELKCVECGEQATRSLRVRDRTKLFCETHLEALLAELEAAGALSDAETAVSDRDE
jgi:hypothetical protein